jgi:TBC1 domain family member 20
MIGTDGGVLDRSPKEIERCKAELSDLIVEILRRNPFLCYFQGYHDICQVLLLVLGAESCSLAVSHLSLLRIRDFMLPSLSPALSHLRLLPPILSAVDPELCSHLSQTQPFFALAATLTLYAHDIQEYGDIARLFDVLLAREAVFSVYLFAVVRATHPLAFVLVQLTVPL